MSINRLLSIADKIPKKFKLNTRKAIGASILIILVSFFMNFQFVFETEFVDTANTTKNGTTSAVCVYSSFAYSWATVVDYY
jgi:hypothetical protein